jgi:hypothetical protein
LNPWFVIKMLTTWPSGLMRGIPPLDVCHFEYYQGGECLS